MSRKQAQVTPKPRKKGFDAVVESRKWKEAVTGETAGMSRKEVLAHFNRPRTVAGSCKKVQARVA